MAARLRFDTSGARLQADDEPGASLTPRPASHTVSKSVKSERTIRGVDAVSRTIALLIVRSGDAG